MKSFFVRIPLFACLLFFGAMPLLAQDADTIATGTDSTTVKKRGEGWFSKDYPKPSKALILSIIPGGGQAYNKKWWKMPIVYGAMAGMIYLVDRNTDEYLYYKRAYRRKVRGLPHDLSGQGGLDSAPYLKASRDQADKNTQLSYIGLFAVYGLAGIEAFVDAHLSSFDVSDDLSIRVQPTEMGLTLTISF